MKTYSFQTNIGELDQNLENMKNNADHFDIIFIFTSRENIKIINFSGKIKSVFPNSQLLGCSTSGEIGEAVEDNSISVLGIQFAKTEFSCASVAIERAETSYETGRAMAQKLNRDDIAGVFVLLPGLNVNGSQFTKGLRDILPDQLSISSGMVGDGLNFAETYTLYNDELTSNQAIMVAFYGPEVNIFTGSRGGWRPFGPRRRVTKVENNIFMKLIISPPLIFTNNIWVTRPRIYPPAGFYTLLQLWTMQIPNLSA